jgi:phage/plasmid-like protein (TIGR03299 family)
MTTFAITDNLDWSVSKKPLYFIGEDGKNVVWKERTAVVRDDNGKCLGAVSPDYETVQNQDLLALIQPMVDEEVLTIENMGYLHHGSKVFVQAKINEEFRVLGEDYSSYITLLNGHTGNASVAIGTAAFRVICGNTFAMAYTGIGEKFKHQVGVNQRLLDSQAVVNYVKSAMEKYSDHVEVLAGSPCTGSQFRNALSRIFNKEADKIAQVHTLNRLFHEGAGNEGRTFYDAFNAITDFSSNLSRKNPAGRFVYANFMTGSSLNQRAMRVLSDLATV